jgi:uncharacterized protein YjbI with pentapeptide repeats
MKAEELLRRYAAGERDFRGVNLRGQSFKGKDLSGANFSEADIRGANFTNAKLTGANFSGGKAGLQQRRVFFFVSVALTLLGLSGLASVISGNYLASLLIIASKQITIVPGLVVLIIYLIFLISIICQNFEVAARITLMAVVIIFTVCLAIGVVSFGSINSFDNVVKSSASSVHVNTKRPLTNAIAITVVGAAASSFAAAIANTIIVTAVVTASFSLAWLEVIANLRFIAYIFAILFPYFVYLRFFLIQATAYHAAFTTAVFGYNLAGSIVSKDGSSGVAMMASAFDHKISSAIGSAIAATIILLSTYISQQILANKKKYSLVRKIIIALAVGGGTSFRHADLTDADFTFATLKSTDFRRANLTRTCWRNAQKLDCIRPGMTYLQDAKVQQLLITGQGQDQNFDRHNLRGVNLQGANLADASFIRTDLSEANLQDTDLSRAKLVQTQLDETDLTGATLTGAFIEDWGITSHTKLHSIKCRYVFMRLPTKDDPEPRRKPHNREEEFEDGDFADFIKPIVDTLDLYHNQRVDPRAIAISFKHLAENNPDAKLEIVAMEKRGQDKFLLRAATAPNADHSALSAEYFTTYNQIKALAEAEVQALLAEKNSRISSLENMVETALKHHSFYSSIQIQEVGNMTSNPGGFSVGGSVGGDIRNLQGDNNRAIQGDNNQGVLGDNNQVTQGQGAGTAEEPLTKADVIALLAELDQLVRGAELPEDTKEEATLYLSAAKKATEKEEPKKETALTNLQTVAETLETASKTVNASANIWDKAKPIIIKVATWLGAAAGSYLLGL